jgi:hypothetical protein
VLHPSSTVQAVKAAASAAAVAAGQQCRSTLGACLVLLLLAVIMVMMLLFLQAGLLCGLWGAACVTASINISGTCSCHLPDPSITTNCLSSSTSSSNHRASLAPLLTIAQLQATLQATAAAAVVEPC